ncbi:hypothetical protein H3C70_01100 [Patescibacteria group bacterium]|nr:hypothetical protein [Patescibacteria group bacterium]
MSQKYRYHNITISGLPGCGSTTMLGMLKEELGNNGGKWTGFSGGEFMRDYAIVQGLFKENTGLHHDATVYPPDFDRQVDLGMRERLQKGKHQIFEAWLSGFMAQGVEGTLKVLMICSDEAVRVDRIVNRDNVSPQQAIDNMRVRYEKNTKKWREMYAKEWNEWVVQKGVISADKPIDFWNPKLYDLTIDTYKLSREQSLQTVLDAIQAQS